jgi:IS605 OrfB family transposase
MKAIRTVNIPLNLTPEQEEVTLDTMGMGVEIWNEVAQDAHKHNTSNYLNLNKFCYAKLRDKYPAMPSGILQAIERSVAGNAAVARSNKIVPLMVKKKLSLPLSRVTITIRGDQVTYSTTGKRVSTIISIPDWFSKKYPDAKPTVGSITYDTRHRFVLHLQVEIETKQTKGTEVVGIDRGIYHVLTTSKEVNISSKHIRSRAREVLYDVRRLQQKGTKSAKKRLKTIHSKRQRFMRDVNHCISKDLSNDKSVSVYVLENLKGIRPVKKEGTSKGSKVNNWLSNWSFFQLQTFIEYKCEEQGIAIAYVSPDKTSKTCSNCNFYHKTKNRHKNHFVCFECGYKEHADINAAKNIRDKYLFAHVGKAGRIQPSECWTKVASDCELRSDNPTG